jgi:hypothetical protein
MFFCHSNMANNMKYRYIYLQTHLSKRVFLKLYIIWKDLTPRVFPLSSQCLPLYHCATLKHMIIGQNFWYLKLLFVIQTWQIYMNFRYIYLQTYDQKEWKDLTPRVFPLFSQCTYFLPHRGFELMFSSKRNRILRKMAYIIWKWAVPKIILQIARKVLSNLSKIFRAYGYKMAEKALSHMLLKLINNRA